MGEKVLCATVCIYVVDKKFFSCKYANSGDLSRLAFVGVSIR